MFEVYVARRKPADADVLFRVVVEVATEAIVSVDVFVPPAKAADLQEPDLGR